MAGLFVACIGLLISFASAIASMRSVGTTRELHAASVRRAEFSIHRDKLVPLQRDLTNFAIDLKRSSEPTVTVPTLARNYEGLYSPVLKVASELERALAEIEDAAIFGKGWTTSAEALLYEIETLFDEVFDPQMPEAGRRASAQNLARLVERLPTAVRQKIRSEIEQHIGARTPRRWYFLWLA